MKIFQDLNTFMSLLTVISYCGMGIVLFVVWYFDMKREQKRTEQWNHKIDTMETQHQAQLDEQRDIRTAILNQYAEYMQEMREMYTSNVTLVEKYDAHATASREQHAAHMQMLHTLTRDLKDAYTQNADVLREMMSELKHNQYCPVIRNSAIGEEICMDVLKKKNGAST